MQLAHRLGLAATQGHAQIEQAQYAVIALVQVGRFDIAVNHTLAVQAAEGFGSLGGCGQGLHHAELVAAL